MSEPRYTDAFATGIAVCVAFDFRSEFLYRADDFMAWNHRAQWMPKFSIDHVEIGATYAAGQHANQDLPGARRRLRKIDCAQRGRLSVE